MYRRTTMICSFILEEEILVCFELREYFRFCYNSFSFERTPIPRFLSLVLFSFYFQCLNWRRMRCNSSSSSSSSSGSSGGGNRSFFFFLLFFIDVGKGMHWGRSFSFVPLASEIVHFRHERLNHLSRQHAKFVHVHQV